MLKNKQEAVSKLKLIFAHNGKKQNGERDEIHIRCRVDEKKIEFLISKDKLCAAIDKRTFQVQKEMAYSVANLVTYLGERNYALVNEIWFQILEAFLVFKRRYSD